MGLTTDMMYGAPSSRFHDADQTGLTSDIRLDGGPSLDSRAVVQATLSASAADVHS